MKAIAFESFISSIQNEAKEYSLDISSDDIIIRINYDLFTSLIQKCSEEEQKQIETAYAEGFFNRTSNS